MAVEIDSCLIQDQSGLEDPAPLDTVEQFDLLEEQATLLGGSVTYPEVFQAEERKPDVALDVTDPDILPPFIEVGDLEPKLSAMELAAEDALGVAVPKWARIFQGRASTSMRRTAAGIKYVVWHTPEGGEQGTLGVLNGGRAGFDVFAPTTGRIYKCNDWWNRVAHQAGDWEYNKVSVGFEMGDYAANSGNWSEGFYRHLATVNAFLGEILTVPTINGSRGRPGFIDHAEVTPGWRTDPGARFPREKMLQMIADMRGGRTTPRVKPSPVRASRIDIVCEPQTASQPIAKAMERAFKAMGMNYTSVYTSTEDVRYASYRARQGRLGANICIVTGTAVLPRLHPQARQALTNSRGGWYPKDSSDLWKATGADGTMADQARGCIRAYAIRHGKRAATGLDAFERAIKGKAQAR